jgi:DNA-binding response OmpR family regulator
MATLLVVEDEPHIASGLRFNLEAEGHAVELVESGAAALAAIAARPGAIDLMVLDVMLPGMSGFGVAAAARARGWFTPILMLTARGRAEDVLQGFEAGADDYLPKPFELTILVARVGALLRRRGWQAARPSVRPAQDVFSFGDRTAPCHGEVRSDAAIHHFFSEMSAGSPRPRSSGSR